MSSENRTHGGLPFKAGARPGAPRIEEQWAGANQAKDETLRLRKARRQARAEGVEIRHSDYGYSVIGADRKSVNGRNDMSLKEIESWISAQGR